MRNLYQHYTGKVSNTPDQEPKKQELPQLQWKALSIILISLLAYGTIRQHLSGTEVTAMERHAFRAGREAFMESDLSSVPKQAEYARFYWAGFDFQRCEEFQLEGCDKNVDPEDYLLKKIQEMR